MIESSEKSILINATIQTQCGRERHIDQSNKADLLTGGARAGCLRRRRAEEEQRQALDGAALARPTGCTDSRGRHRGSRDEVIRRLEQRQTLVVVIGIDVATLAGGRRQPDVVVVLVRIILLRIVVHATGLPRLHDVRRRRALFTGRGVLLQGIRVVRGPVPGPRAAVNSLCDCRLMGHVYIRSDGDLLRINKLLFFCYEILYRVLCVISRNGGCIKF